MNTQFSEKSTMPQVIDAEVVSEEQGEVITPEVVGKTGAEKGREEGFSYRRNNFRFVSSGKISWRGKLFIAAVAVLGILGGLLFGLVSVITALVVFLLSPLVWLLKRVTGRR